MKSAYDKYGTEYEDQVVAQANSQSEYYPQDNMFPISAFKKENPEFTKWQLDVSDTLETLEMHFRGYIWDEAKNKWIKRYEPDMNEKGISFVMKRLRVYLDRNTMLTNLSDDEIHNICESVMIDTINIIYMNYKAFGIEKSRVTDIVNTIDHQLFFTLKRAWGAEERKSLRESSQRLEQHSFQEAQQQKGRMFGLFNKG